MRAIAIYIHSSPDTLSRTTKEIATNTIFGTINACMELYALWDELEGTGVPIAYLVEKVISDEIAPNKTTIRVQDRFWRLLQ